MRKRWCDNRVTRMRARSVQLAQQVLTEAHVVKYLYKALFTEETDALPPAPEFSASAPSTEK